MQVGKMLCALHTVKQEKQISGKEEGVLKVLHMTLLVQIQLVSIVSRK